MTSEPLPEAVGCEQLTDALRRSGALGDGRVSDCRHRQLAHHYPLTNHSAVPVLRWSRTRCAVLGHLQNRTPRPRRQLAGAVGTRRLNFIPKSGPLCGGVSSRAALKGVPMRRPRPGTCCSRTSPNPYHRYRVAVPADYGAMRKHSGGAGAVACRVVGQSLSWYFCRSMVRCRGDGSVSAKPIGAVHALLRPPRRQLAARAARALRAAVRRGAAAARYHTHRNVTIVQGDAHVWNSFVPRDGGMTHGSSTGTAGTSEWGQATLLT